MKRRIGDRKDGYKLRKTDPFFRVIPHIMKERSDAQVFFEDRIYLEEPNKLIRELRKEGHKIGFLHILMASMIRTISQKPKINRFISGKKAYARNEIVFSLAVKKNMSPDSEETIIKLVFKPEATIYDVIGELNKKIEGNKGVTEKNETDKVAKLMSFFPSFGIGIIMSMFRFLDNHRMLPKSLINASPFHTSCFITDLGSLGIRPVYHHLYNFGTTTIFIAFGTRSRESKIEKDLNVINKKAIDLRIVVDERVVDGYYFASAIKYAKDIMSNPIELLQPPKNVVFDNEI